MTAIYSAAALALTLVVGLCGYQIALLSDRVNLVEEDLKQHVVAALYYQRQFEAMRADNEGRRASRVAKAVGLVHEQ